MQQTGRAPHHRRPGIAAGILIVAVGLSVRFPITSVSPLLSNLGADYSLSPSALAVLTAIPVLLFGLASPLAPLLASKLGLAKSLSVLLAALALASLLRPLNAPLLYTGTVVVGGAIALLGILAPQIIRQSMPDRAGLWTGIYTTMFGMGAAAGAACAVPLMHLFGGSSAASLTAWGVPLLVAAGLALALGPSLGSAPTAAAHHADGPAPLIFRAHGLWVVTGFFGFQALVYFALTSWLPTMLTARGMPQAEAGLQLAWMSLAGLPASLIAPVLASRPRLRAPLTGAVGLLATVGLLGLAYAPLSFAGTMVVLLGIAQAAAFGLAIALIVFTAPSLAQTASFSAVSQGVGYALAAAGPLLMGLLVQAELSWPMVTALLITAAVGEGVFGVLASRASNTLRR